MIIDSSAIVAIVLAEAEADDFLKAISTAEKPLISAANWLEVALVLDKRSARDIGSRFDDVMAAGTIEVAPVTLEIAQLARIAHQRFGRNNHPARLNYGDCFAYALAKATGEPLLFKGNDFSQTDIPSALPA